MDDDDWLDDSTAGQQGHKGDPLVDREWEKLATKYNDAGYREGITDGKLTTLQQGFDAGFELSVSYARALGSLRGRTTALLGYLQSAQAASASGTGSKSIDLVDQTRALLVDLGRLRRDDILPVDTERVAHEEEDRIARGEDAYEAFELEKNEAREMEGLERALEGAGPGTNPAGGVLKGGSGAATRWEGKDGWEIVRGFEGRLEGLMEAAMRS